MFNYQKLFTKSFLHCFFILFIVLSCQKGADEKVQPENGIIKIINLMVDDSVLKAWVDTAVIVVEATGNNLNYEWSCNHGTLRGSGEKVKYAAGQCCVGLNTITCRVFNDSSSVSIDTQIRIISYFDN